MAPATTIPYDVLKHRLLAVKEANQLTSLIANAPFDYKVETAFLFLGFIGFYLVDEAAQELYIAGVSDTEHYRLAVQGTQFKPSDYRIPLDTTDNSIVQAMLRGGPVVTTDWETLKQPSQAPGAARLDQAASGIAHSEVHPLQGARRGALMYNFFQYSEAIGDQPQEFMQRYTALVTEVMDANPGAAL